MFRRLTLAALALALVPSALLADDGPIRVRGQYVEARTCDVWTGPCFANADFNLGGKNAVMAWRVEKGSADGVSLDGLGIVAIISAQNTLGLEQSGPAKCVLIIDKRADDAQRVA